MAGFDKLKTMLDAALKQAGDESSMLLGQTLTVSESDVINTNRMTYFADMDDAIFVVGVESREEYPGFFYIVFSLGDAIVMSGTLLGIPPARISEKRKLCIFEADDGDAFGEIANQIIGSFNSVFQPKLPNKVHLKLLTPKKYIPEMDELTDDSPLPDGDYLMFRSPLEVKGLEMKCLDILMPFPLANLFDPQPLAVAATEADTDEMPSGMDGDVSSDGNVQSLPETILIMGENAEERQMVREYLSSTGLNLIDAPLGADMPELFAQGEVKVAVIELRDTEDRDLAVCSRLSIQSRNSSLPIIMCADQWTRTGVLKALKCGAKDILIKPFDANELMTKVNKFLKAA